MSYDIRFGVKIEGVDNIYPIDEPEYASPTYNVGTMFRKCMNWDFDQSEWYRCSDVIDNITDGIKEIVSNEKEYKQYEPDNGWGSTSTVYKTLTSIVDKINELKESIPIDKLWIQW